VDERAPDRIEVMTGGALRPGEAAALLLRNLFIDAENEVHAFLIVDGTIVLRDGSVWRQPETKTGRARTVALPAAAVHAVRQRLAVIEALQAAEKRDSDDPEDLLFATRAGTPLQSTNVRRSFGYATDLLDGITLEGFATRDFTPHMARRSAATAVYHHPDGSAASTSAMLGHSGEAQLPAYVAQLGLPAPDFSVIAGLDELLSILDETTL
jgi:integrase